MPDSIRELVMKNVKTTLEGITTGAGYANTIASVQRFRQSGQSTLLTPCIFIMEREEDARDEPDPLITKNLLIELHVIARQDDVSDVRNGAEIMNSLRADIEKALLTTRTRGGYAMDTKPVQNIEGMDVDTGLPALETLMAFDVMYRHRNTDPTAQV